MLEFDSHFIPLNIYTLDVDYTDIFVQVTNTEGNIPLCFCYLLPILDFQHHAIGLAATGVPSLSCFLEKGGGEDYIILGRMMHLVARVV